MISLKGIRRSAALFTGLLCFSVFSAKAGMEKHIECLPPVLAVVNEEPLRQESLLHAMTKNRHAIARYFHRTYGIQPENEFWNLETRYGGESPLARLVQISMEEGIEALLLEQIAAANRLSGTKSLPPEERLGAHNQHRRDMLSSGGLVYGPRQFKALAFRDHSMALLKVELEALLLQGNLKLPEWATWEPGKPIPSTIEALVRALRMQSKVISAFP